MELRQIASFSDELKTFIQSGHYEPYILALMNKSTKIFPGQYACNKDQSCNQCDFYEIHTFEKFEAKLPFDKKEGQLICSNNANLKEWMKFMIDEEAELKAKKKQEKKEAKEKKKKEKELAKKEKEKETSKKTTSSKAAKKATSALTKTVNSAANTIGREVGKKIVRGIFDTLLKG